MIGVLVVWVILGAIVGAIATHKGRSFVGWWLYGFLLFPIALIHILVARPDAKSLELEALAGGGARKCPSCAEVIKAEAKVCRFCGRDVPPVVAKPYEYLG